MERKEASDSGLGYKFSFEDEGNVIEAWFSAVSGLEKVYVNGQLVAEQRNLSRKSVNTFSIDGNEYSTGLEIVSALKGPILCTLQKNGKNFRRQKLIFRPDEPPEERPHFLKKLSVFLLFGALFGFAHSYWQLPDKALYLFIALLLLLFFVDSIPKASGDPVIEEEDIQD
jgi:hypothetical protein